MSSEFKICLSKPFNEVRTDQTSCNDGQQFFIRRRLHKGSPRSLHSTGIAGFNQLRSDLHHLVLISVSWFSLFLTFSHTFPRIGSVWNFNMPGPLSLKQRLQALSTNIAQATSSGEPFSPKSPGPRIRAFLSQNVMRRPQDASNGNSSGSNGNTSEQGYSQDRVQEVMSRLIFQAGVDYEWAILLCA